MESSRLSGFSQTLSIARSDRWQVCHRLTELDIVATCSKNGSLAVEIHHPIDLLQVRSVLQQLSASRQQLVDLLERCWHQL